MGNLKPLASPDTLDPLVVDRPARLAQQPGDLAIAIAAVLPSKLDDIGREPLLVVTTARDFALRRACCPSAAQARRSETCNCARTCSMQARRRAGRLRKAVSDLTLDKLILQEAARETSNDRAGPCVASSASLQCLC